MRLLIGIGNPGPKYRGTRHNAGFIALDYFGEKYGLRFEPGKGKFYFAKGQFAAVPFMLIKPTTYVNLTGEAVSALSEELNVMPEDIVVIHDDINLPAGMVKVKMSGSDGGHNGIHSIIYHLQTGDFPRIRIGIGSDFAKGDMAAYVLSRFESDEQTLMNDAFMRSSVLIKAFIADGMKGMLDINSRLARNSKKPKKTPNDGGIDG